MIAAILKEPNNENRVSLLPEQVQALIKKNVQVVVEEDAGKNASAWNNAYTDAGATIVSRQKALESDLILSIHPLTDNDITHVKANAVLLGVYQPLFCKDIMQSWASKNLNCFSIDMIPRTTRAQSMDVLSSQANIAGYRAVLLAATLLPHYFPMFMTAAGSIAPAKVLILGAGVAGLQAIATARRLGAVVEVFDTRPAVKEEVQSLGAKFIEVEGAADASKAGGYAVEQTEEYKQKQQQKIAASVAKSNVIITTAQIPGRQAPILITQEMLHSMKTGSVIIDLAAATGGNTPLTKNNEHITTDNGVLIVGNSNLQSGMPSDASKLYGKNIMNFLQLIITNEGAINLNFEDELVKGTCITNNGKIVHERVIG
ncbi:MAG: Re/Si-specific NAD(P)(+) transhydrogenase subunit alpha [Chitinophagaceae bacterium]|nr:Re/Si-specific NAD(P)(+) transhydrogenase subunit alpha [Chitinophagaceae bacterium]MCW5905945.1 Re/Si-specific NAD(P)(+) transhydrogenase subunit alpha [Chitinophagaceae bacterium]